MTTIASDVAIPNEDSDPSNSEDFESNNSDDEELNTEEILKAYQELLENFIKVRNLNKSLKDKVFDLVGENKWLEGAMSNYKHLLKEKDERIL